MVIVFAALFIDLFSGGLMAAGLVVFAVLAGALYFIFRLLKNSVRMAFRLAVVGSVMLILTVGGLSLWWFGSEFLEAPKSKPPAKRSR